MCIYWNNLLWMKGMPRGRNRASLQLVIPLHWRAQLIKIVIINIKGDLASLLGVSAATEVEFSTVVVVFMLAGV